jgi:hypothetical protein
MAQTIARKRVRGVDYGLVFAIAVTLIGSALVFFTK